MPEEWEDLPTNPDPERNLGYEMIDWDVITPAQETDHLVLLPRDERHLRDNAFIVVDESLLCDVSKCV